MHSIINIINIKYNLYFFELLNYVYNSLLNFKKKIYFKKM